MYEKVKTRRQQKDFEKTWGYFCSTYGWRNDSYSKKGSRYNLILPRAHLYQRNHIIGTIEFNPYDSSSYSNMIKKLNGFSFMHFDEIKKNPYDTWEIDKVCIQKDYQRKGYLQKVFEIIYEHATENGVNYYISLLELRFYRLLKMKYGSLVEKKGNAIITSHTSLIPTIIHIDEYIRNKKESYRYTK